MAAATAAIPVTNAFASVLSDVKDVDFVRMYLNKYQLN